MYDEFVSRGATFNNYHDWTTDKGADIHYWDGWAYSNHTDTGLSGLDGQYTAMASIPGGQNDANYGVAYFGFYDTVPTITFDTPCEVASACFTNNTYVYYSMLYGDSYAKKFGGADGSDEDWFLLTITGLDAAGAVTGTVEFHLADFTFADNDEDCEDYIIDDWTLVDLTPLGDAVSSIEFELSSSDVGTWGMNTPAYFAMDNMTIVPEPAAFALLIAGLIAVMAWRRLRG